MFKVSAATALALGTAMLPFAGAGCRAGSFRRAVQPQRHSLSRSRPRFQGSAPERRAGADLQRSNSGYLEKRKWIERVDVPGRAHGTMSVCVPVKQQGRYVDFGASRHERQRQVGSQRWRGCRAIPT
jgi:hypothetical protein